MFLIIWWLKIENKEKKKKKKIESIQHSLDKHYNILICADRNSHEINNIYEDFHRKKKEFIISVCHI